MAFPVDAGRAGTNGTTAATNKVCNLPGSIGAGNLLILVLRSAGADTHSTPGGWNPLDLNNTADASDDTISVWYRLADGGEGATVTVNGTASLKFAAHSWRITGAADPADQVPQISTAATGTSTGPNPGPLSPTGGAKDYLWIWLGGWEGEQTSPPAGQPTNYVNPVGANSGTAGAITTNCRVAGATRQNNTATEDPPAWTISASDDWTAWTVAIHPVPTARRARVSWAELQVPDAPRRSQVSWSELEMPDAPRRAQASWAELEVPTAPRRAQVSWAELEAPDAPRRAQASWAEMEVPDPPTSNRQAQVSWAELEVPTAPRRAQASWAELEVPDAPRRSQVSWAELETPDAPRRAQASWAELEVPDAPRRAQVSWGELEVPTAPRRSQVSWAELEVPDSPSTDRRGQVSWAELEVPSPPESEVEARRPPPSVGWPVPDPDYWLRIVQEDNDLLRLGVL